MYRLELLAPAGNFDCLKAAVQAGADAVYLAGKNFGARSFADNFDPDQLKEAVRYAHLRGKKIHVTVNTVVFDREFAELEEYLKFLDEIRVDAVIVQDLGVFEAAKRICARAELHASTQLTVHNLAGVKEMYELGADRVVLSRELSFEEIEYIAKNKPEGIDIEIFAHGALCMCYSGQCMMSAVMGGRSGNRGSCAQPCRLPYSNGALKEGKKGTYLSLKDMSIINHLDKVKSLLKYGDISLKLEGRMKGAAYVAEVVRSFRKCIDQDRRPTKDEWEELNSIFYRGGLTDGYFTGNIGTHMFAFDKPDNPYKRSNGGLEASLKEYVSADNIKRAVEASIRVEPGKKAELTLWDDEIKISVLSEDEVETAKNRATEAERIKEQVLKTGGSVLKIENCEAVVGENAFIPIKTINELRRRAASEFEERIIKSYNDRKSERRGEILNYNGLPDVRGGEPAYTAYVRNMEQYGAVEGFKFEYIYAPLDLIYDNKEIFGGDKERIVIAPPSIIKDGEYSGYSAKLEELFDLGYTNLLVENIGELYRNKRFNLFLGHRLNVYNSRSLAVLEFLARPKLITVSPELNAAAVRDLKKSGACERIVYGYLPVMVAENCIAKNIGDCPCGNGYARLKDRKGNIFPVIRDGSSCRSALLNTAPTYWADKKRELKKLGCRYLRLMFSIESGGETERICRAYFSGENIGYEGKFTR